SFFINTPVISEPTGDLHLNDSEKRFTENPCTHLRLTFGPIGEDYRNFYYPEPIFNSRKLHLDLKCITNEPDSIKWDGFQYLSPITNEASCGITDRNTGNHPHICRRKIGH